MLKVATNGSSSGIKRFQVIGERCSGTNFAEAFFQENFPIKHIHTLGWKHGFPAFNAVPRDLLTVVMFRNSHSWLRSMYGKPWHTTEEIRKLSFPDFIRAQWDTYVDNATYFKFSPGSLKIGQPLQLDRHPIDGTAFSNIIQLRNTKTRAWLGLANRKMNVVYIRHEDLVSETEKIASLISENFDLPEPGDLVIPQGKFGWKWSRRAASHPLPDLPLPREDAEFINSELDMDQENSIGYSY